MTRDEAIEILRKLPIGLMDLTNEQKWDLTEEWLLWEHGGIRRMTFLRI